MRIAVRLIACLVVLLALSACPSASDALLGKVRALTYLGQAVEAIAAVDQLLGERWHLGDARYWRVERDAARAVRGAWSDVELADKLLINAEVPKLAGIMAYRRHELDVSRTKFELARQRNGNNCETGFHLGVVLADQRSWGPTLDVLVETCTCIERAERDYTEPIATIRASSEPEDRKARKIAKRTTEARQYAEKVASDVQFGERAREILARLGR